MLTVITSVIGFVVLNARLVVVAAAVVNSVVLSVVVGSAVVGSVTVVGGFVVVFWKRFHTQVVICEFKTAVTSLIRWSPPIAACT